MIPAESANSEGIVHILLLRMRYCIFRARNRDNMASQVLGCTSQDCRPRSQTRNHSRELTPGRSDTADRTKRRRNQHIFQGRTGSMLLSHFQACKHP